MLLALQLLDRQILDRDGEPVGKVDDLELGYDEDGVPYVAALLVGQQALGRRIGGRLGRWITTSAERLSPTPDPAPIRIPYDLVRATGGAVDLSVRRELLLDPPLEAWLGEHLIGRIPGASHAE
jgi:sporulation protein YlmC with PRC-barrel domain